MQPAAVLAGIRQIEAVVAEGQAATGLSFLNMDLRLNPYAPGAGTPPPELAGRDSLIESLWIVLDRIRAGRAAKSVILLGLRGSGKTV
jgi:Cdc6-like AAA superfamily ATPase